MNKQISLIKIIGLSFVISGILLLSDFKKLPKRQNESNEKNINTELSTDKND